MRVRLAINYIYQLIINLRRLGILLFFLEIIYNNFYKFKILAKDCKQKIRFRR